MSKFKIGIWAVVFVFILLFFLHNQDFFMTKNAFDVNVFGIPSLAEYSGFFQKAEIPAVPNVVIFLGFFVLGVAVSYFFNFFGWLRSKRAIRRLSTDNEHLNQKVEQLETELAATRGQRMAQLPEHEEIPEAELASKEDEAAESAMKKG